MFNHSPATPEGGRTMTDIVELERRVDRMDIQLQETRNRVVASDTILERLEESYARLIDTVENFASVVTDVRITLKEMQNEIKNNTTGMKDLKDNTNENMNEIKHKVGELEKKFEESECKSKIDWRVILKDFFTKWIWILLGSALGGTYLIEKLLIK